MLLGTPLFLGFLISNPLRKKSMLRVVQKQRRDTTYDDADQDPLLRADKPIPIRVRQEDDEIFHDIIVDPEETILSALERSGLSELPSDCRRGNCLTCAAKVESIAATESDTGLSQQATDYLSDQSLILTCSTYVLEPGLTLLLGQYDDAWKQIYQNRLLEGEPEFAQSVRARAIRKTAEMDVSNWIEETKRALESSDEE